MEKNSVKLSYIAAQARVRLSFAKADCDRSEYPPMDLMGRAVKKLEAEKNKGAIAFYRFYETRFHKAWQTLRKSDAAPDTEVSVTLASGSPHLPGLSVERCEKGTYIGKLTIDAPHEEVAKWKHYFVKLTVGKMLRDLGVFNPPNASQIQRLLLRAKYGAPVIDIPLIDTPKQLASSMRAEKPYVVIEEKDARDISLVIYDVNKLKEETHWRALTQEIYKLVGERNRSGEGTYKFLYSDLVRRLRSAQRGPEGLGLDLPFVMLAAVDTKYLSTDTMKMDINIEAAAKAREKVKAINPMEDIELELDVASDEMLAVISGFKNYSQEGNPEGLDMKWLISELDSLGVTEEAYSHYIGDLEIRMIDGDSIIDQTIAKGKQVVLGSGPHLVEVKHSGSHSETDLVDIRKIQHRKFVRSGELIAEVVFSVPKADGETIFGEVIEAPFPRMEDIEVGENIEVKDDREFFATADGVPQVEEKSITLETVLMHEGNVSFSTGNINFDGVVTISGSVSAGVEVVSKSDIEIAGSVDGGILLCGKNLTVGMGVNTSPGGFIKCAQELKASFVENSEIFIQGKTVVEKALVMTRLISSSWVKAQTIVGGFIKCEEFLECEDLGRDSGQRTVIHMGYDLRAAQVKKSRERRLEFLKFHKERVEKQLHSILKKNAQQQSKDHDEKRFELQEKIDKLSALIEKAEDLLMDTPEPLLNNKGKVIVTGVAAKGTLVRIGDKEIEVHESMREIVILAKSRHGPLSIVPLDSDMKSLIAEEKSASESEESETDLAS